MVRVTEAPWDRDSEPDKFCFRESDLRAAKTGSSRESLRSTVGVDPLASPRYAGRHRFFFRLKKLKDAAGPNDSSRLNDCPTRSKNFALVD